MDFEEKETALMMKEWEDWKAWCVEFKAKTGKEVNEKEYERLAGLVERWGYSLLELRNHQATIGKPDLLEYENAAMFRGYLKK